MAELGLIEFLTTEQVAEILHCSTMSVKRYARQGVIESYYVARKYLFKPEAVTKFLDESKVA
jgi:excisionase family DNA binding protein